MAAALMLSAAACSKTYDNHTIKTLTINNTCINDWESIGENESLKKALSFEYKYYLEIENKAKEIISTSDRQLVYINGYRVQGCLSVIAKWIWDDFQDSQEVILKTLLLLDNTTANLLRK